MEFRCLVLDGRLKVVTQRRCDEFYKFLLEDSFRDMVIGLLVSTFVGKIRPKIAYRNYALDFYIEKKTDDGGESIYKVWVVDIDNINFARFIIFTDAEKSQYEKLLENCTGLETQAQPVVGENSEAEMIEGVHWKVIPNEHEVVREIFAQDFPMVTLFDFTVIGIFPNRYPVRQH
jgi:hypothetical protein